MIFTPYNLSHRPDQTVDNLNKMADRIEGFTKSVKIKSEDGSSVIIIGNQPINPATHKPYDFGINKYKIKGDRLELEGTWTI